MNIPRTVTLLICLACESLAAAAYLGIPFMIPLEFLRWVVVAVLSFFSLTALIMRIGLSDATKTVDGVIEFGMSRRGRIMRAIMRNGRHVDEKHCCDVYIDTSLATALWGGISFLAGAFILFAITQTLTFACVLLAGIGIIGLVFLIVWMDEKGCFNWITRLPLLSLSERTWDILGIIVLVFASMYVVGCAFFVVIYLPLTELMKLGYTLLAATGIYVGTLLLLPIPAYCLGGKKLLLKTEGGKRFCAIIR